MKKRTYLFSSVFLTLISVQALASEAQFDVDLLASDYSYKEPSIMSLKGTLIGIGANLTLRNEGLMYRLEGSYQKGNLDYTSTSTGSDDGIPNYIYELRGMLGVDMPGSGALVTPYTGLGLRRLVDKSSGRLTTTGNWGYERTQDYVYIPVGVFWQSAVNGWAIKTNLEYDYLVYGHNRSETGYVTGYDLTFEQTSGYGLRGSVSLETPLQWGAISSVGITPYINYWNIDSSDRRVVGNQAYIEPKNTTEELGIKIRFGF
ncbi:outer membrane beta-barrel protein [Vibrio salinus]|uniref:outer membrane beta-barrel protein n=1 Tax=Vibrio salinus TaxID=2899784 RepID=UPI001E3F37B1|nr:outer membrane beta-barrel protein [Vibrio salinus]MCE0493993.1 hypothetical protein [Vibrio salinus]